MNDQEKAGQPANPANNPGAASATGPTPSSTATIESRDTPDSQPQSLQPGQLKKSNATDGQPLDLEFILDIPLQVKVEVGRTRMMIQELLQLGKGSVVELNKLIGEPFEVLVNEKLVARGEVVVVNDHFGIRLTDIISPNERVKSLA
jgi:flagellar motor switch protein FliN/FliY